MVKPLLIVLLAVGTLTGNAQKKIYNKGWIDFNKNGVKDIYEDPKQPITSRVQNLLDQMNIEEKAGQLLTPLGWPMYERKDAKLSLTPLYKEEIAKRHIGMLWAFMRADPWTQRSFDNGLNPLLATQASNMLQRYAIENSRLGIPLLLAEEAAHGHMAIGTTVFPTSIGLSSTWNPELIQKMSVAIAQEVKLQGGHIAYGPVLDLLRDPRWSRTEECFGEDPYLISQFGIAMVKGLQNQNPETHVISTLKHFTAYGMSEGGHNGGSAHIGEYELNEYVLPPFKAAVEAGAGSVMAAYNEVDGTPCHSSKAMLTDLLRGQWGFSGFTVSDLGGLDMLVGHGVAENKKDAALKGFKAGVDSDLGTNCFSGNLVQLVNEGKLDMATLDASVGRVLKAKFEMGLFDAPFVKEAPFTPQMKSEHRELARKVAQESMILLKNEGSLLPLSKTVKSIAVIGPNADNAYNMLGDYTAPQLSSDVVTVLQGIKSHVSSGTTVRYAKGCTIRSEGKAGFAEAIEAAKASDVVVMVMGGSSARDFSSMFEATGALKVTPDMKNDLECGEGSDRATLNLMGEQLSLMNEIHKLGKPTVLVLIKGRPLTISWEAEHMPAIIDAWYPGMEGGNAIADVLFGDVNPAGRLSVSIPRSVGQIPVFYNTHRASNRNDYTDEKGSALYSFGHGLSYTTFDYKNLVVSKQPANSTIAAKLSVDVTNSGKMDGDEVVQVYLNQKYSSHATPEKRLVAFKRVNIPMGKTVTVTFDIPTEQLKLYQGGGKWDVESGKYTLMVGKSSDKIELKDTFEL